MKKFFSGLLLVVLTFLTIGTQSASAATNGENELSSPSENTEIFIDKNLVGTKIDGPVTRTGGYLYKNLGYSESNRRKTYLGKVTRGYEVSFGVSLAKGYITIGVAYSSSREFYEYRNTSNFTSTWGVYDKYSGNYMYSTSFVQKNVSWKYYTRAG